jgi:hypothetical protein
LGCRERRLSTGSRNRCREYRGTLEGKLAKRKLNQKRYLKSNGSKTMKKPPKPAPESDDNLLEYIAFMASLLEERKVAKTEMKQALGVWTKKWRQRPLSFWLRHYKLPFRWFKKRDSG